MKSSRFREMSEEELKIEEVSMAEQLFKLRFQLSIGQVENPQRIRQVRRDLARVKTQLRALHPRPAAQGKAGV
jgi:large subunit ribosomal protein L29